MDRTTITEVLNKPIAKDLLRSNIPARLAYTALDGTPRVIPIAFLYDGSRFLIYTLPHAPKIKALTVNPKVAITIDTQGAWPPRVLLVRGTAELEQVEGVPQEYLDASEKVTPAEEFPAWKAGVTGLYRRMTKISIIPEWAKLLDFETTIPKPVEDLVTGRVSQG
jgi:hypothetical protein